MMRTLGRAGVIGAILSFGSVALVPAQRPQTMTTREDTLDARVLDHVRILADADMKGRHAGSQEYLRAAEYAAGVLRSMGLSPAAESLTASASFLQPVPLVRFTFGPDNVLTLRRAGQTHEHRLVDRRYLVQFPGAERVALAGANPVYVGFGISEPTFGWNDMAGLDVAGRVVITTASISASLASAAKLPAPLWKKYGQEVGGDVARITALLARKPSALILVPDDRVAERWRETFDRVGRQTEFAAVEAYPRWTTGEPSVPVLLVHPDVGHQLLGEGKLTGGGRPALLGPQVLQDLELSLAVDARREAVTSVNVVGVIAGTEPDLRQAPLVLGAHLDHVGVVGFAVHPGANDNASGCAAVLEAARLLAASPPRRSVIVALFTAEEIGHLGSMHFLSHPPVPLSQIELGVMVEQVGSRNRQIKELHAIAPASYLQRLVSEDILVKKLDVTGEDAKALVPVLFETDAFSFLLHQRPTILLGSGGFPEHHSPADVVALIDREHLARVTRYLAGLVRLLAR